MSRAFIVLFTILLFSSCRRDVADPHACFDPNVQQILVTNCTMSGCHNSKDKKEGYDFTTYEGIMNGVEKGHASRSEIYQAITSSGEERMPPDKSLSKEEITLIKNWINLGAKINSCTVETCDTAEFTFSKGVQPIINMYCKGCHYPGSSNLIDLSSYSSISNEIKSGNRFMGSIQHLPGYSSMPQNLNKLSNCQIRVIQKWISAGMPEN